jgi:hypothetical protein
VGDAMVQYLMGRNEKMAGLNKIKEARGA